jgi:hypothetical protein
MSVTIARASAGVVASSRASMTTANRSSGTGRSASPAHSAGASCSTVAGSATEAARAISVATSRAVLPLACTAQSIAPIGARTDVSSAGRAPRMTASAVVTIRPRTADFPTPGDPVTTSARRRTPVRVSQSTISVSAAVRPRNR